MPSPPQASGTLDEPGDPRLWFRVAGRLSTGPPHIEKETITASEICFLTATELVRLVRVKELSALEVMEAHLAQIERVNPEVNAIVTLTAEQAMDRARATDDALARRGGWAFVRAAGGAQGPLPDRGCAHHLRLSGL